MEASWHHLPNAKDLRCYLQQGPHLPVDGCGSRVLADVDVDVMSTCISDVPKWVSVFLMNVRDCWSESFFHLWFSPWGLIWFCHGGLTSTTNRTTVRARTFAANGNNKDNHLMVTAMVMAMMMMTMTMTMTMTKTRTRTRSRTRTRMRTRTRTRRRRRTTTTMTTTTTMMMIVKMWRTRRRRKRRQMMIARTRTTTTTMIIMSNDKNRNNSGMQRQLQQQQQPPRLQLLRCTAWS